MNIQTRTVRPATLEDVDAISMRVNEFVRKGDLLPRSPEMIRDTINDWVIGLDGDTVVAIGSLLMYSPVLAEVRSLAVAETAHGGGWGRAIVEELGKLAQERKVVTLFALTRAVPFFLKLGFSITEKELFPQKVWTDCHICPLKEMCDETAVVLLL